MKGSTRIAAVTLLLVLTVPPGGARAASSIVLPRSGQVGLGIMGQGGTLLSSGVLGKEFGSGGGLAVKLRYRMRFERAIGLAFDLQNLNARDPSAAAGAFDALIPPPAVLRERVKLVNAGVEFYQMFDTRERTVKYLSAGFGLVQMSAHLSNGETQFPLAGDGIFLSTGAGLERFFFRRPLHVGKRRLVAFAARPPPGRRHVIGRAAPRGLPRPAQ